MRTKRFVYEAANHKLSLIPSGQEHVNEAARLHKLIKAAEAGIISPLEAVQEIARRNDNA